MNCMTVDVHVRCVRDIKTCKRPVAPHQGRLHPDGTISLAIPHRWVAVVQNNRITLFCPTHAKQAPKKNRITQIP